MRYLNRSIQMGLKHKLNILHVCLKTAVHAANERLECVSILSEMSVLLTVIP